MLSRLKTNKASMINILINNWLSKLGLKTVNRGEEARLTSITRHYMAPNLCSFYLFIIFIIIVKLQEFKISILSSFLFSCKLSFIILSFYISLRKEKFLYELFQPLKVYLKLSFLFSCKLYFVIFIFF